MRQPNLSQRAREKAEGGGEGELNLLIARVDRGSRLWSTRLHSVVKAAVIVRLHIEVSVHTIADFQLRPAVTRDSK